MIPGDTIVAISSSVGEAPRMIVRLSGPDAPRLASQILDVPEPSLAVPGALAARAKLGTLPAFPCTLLTFLAPRSATGEHVCELHIPGNPLLARLVVGALVKHGARQADAGEFTARAYFSGKLDLTQAEGVAATIAARNESELAAARQLAAGVLSTRLRPLLELLADTLALVEAGIDFSDEAISFLPDDQLRARLGDVIAQLEALLSENGRFERLAHEPTVVLAGRPNAGKSTLLNALAGATRAVVSPVAGTTRDVLSARVLLPRGYITMLDVAGIDGSSRESHLDRQMQDRTRQAIESADAVIWVDDGSEPPSDRSSGAAPQVTRQPILTVRTKCDLRPCNDGVCAITGEGLEALRNRIDQCTFGMESGATLSLNVRHRSLIESALESLRLAGASVPEGAEVVALNLRDALDSLGGVLGQVTPDDVLGRIFSSFCIGK